MNRDGAPNQGRVTVAVEPVCVDRETAAMMMGMSLSHAERHLFPSLRLIYSGRLRLVPVEELRKWAVREAHPPHIAR